MTFAGGDKQTDLEIIDTVRQAQYRHHAYASAPDAKYFDSVGVLRIPACAMCCAPRRCCAPA